MSRGDAPIMEDGPSHGARPRRRPESAKEMKDRMRLVLTKKDAVHDLAVPDEYEAAESAGLMRRGFTGLSYDDEMTEHKCEWDENYPEKPERYTAIMNRLTELGLTKRCIHVKADEDVMEYVLLCHTKAHMKYMVAMSKYDIEDLKVVSENFDAIYFNEHTAKCAKLSLTNAYGLVKAVVTGRVQNGLAVVRPPGHHAMEKEYCGYCYINNVAVVAKAILAQPELEVKRIMIVDFDVHHGQATQQMFYDTNEVLYISIHRYEHGNFWPNLRQSNFDFTGNPNSAGAYHNVNIPLNTTGCGDVEYIAIMTNIILPMGYEYQPDLVLFSAGYDACIGCTEYNPDLVIISAGYDSAVGDEKGQMLVTPPFYGHMIKLLSNLANGKLAVILEGGYFLPSLAEGVAYTLKALLDDPTGMLEKLGKPEECVIETINNVVCMLYKHWQCFNSYHSARNPREGLKDIIIRHETSAKRPPYPIADCYPVDTAVRSEIYGNMIRCMKSDTEALVQKPVCYVYSDRMLLHRPKSEHPERPDRLLLIHELFKRWGLDKRCTLIEPIEATADELNKIHLCVYTNLYMDEGKPDPVKLVEASRIASRFGDKKTGDVYVSRGTSKAVLTAAGGLVQVCEAVMRGAFSAGFALIRPPGHHAEMDHASGFCFVNNVAVAAAYIRDEFKCSRVMVLDIDIHHGNGTQHAFYDEDTVLYISIHKYEKGKFFPSMVDAAAAFSGTMKGRGFNVNIPFNDHKMGNADYLAVFYRLILPIAYAYAPQVILVSAGFDAGINDPLGNYKVTPEAFGHFIQLLRPLAQGRIIVALEGGYNITTIRYAMNICVKALLGDPLPRLKFERVQLSTVHTIQEVIKVHRDFWPALNVMRPLKSTVDAIYLTNDTESIELKTPEDVATGFHLGEVNKVMYEFEFMNKLMYDTSDAPDP